MKDKLTLVFDPTVVLWMEGVAEGDVSPGLHNSTMQVIMRLEGVDEKGADAVMGELVADLSRMRG